MSAFRALMEAECRCDEIQAAIGRLKDAYDDDHEIVSMPDIISLLDDLRWHIRRTAEQVARFEKAMGIVRASSKMQKRMPRMPPDSFRGSTRTLRISELVALLSEQKKTGSLWIKAGSERFVLEFSDGAVVHATSDSTNASARLGTILVSQNKISADRLDEFLREYSRQDGRIGEAMTRMELIGEDDLRDALEEQVQALFRHVLELDEAFFCFVSHRLTSLEMRVTLNTTQLMLNAARLADEERADGFEPTPVTEDDMVALQPEAVHISPAGEAEPVPGPTDAPASEPDALSPAASAPTPAAPPESAFGAKSAPPPMFGSTTPGFSPKTHNDGTPAIEVTIDELDIDVDVDVDVDVDESDDEEPWT
ncbi:MAG: DUF4388 domain-containing protein [Planctomycetota bacterium]